MEAQHEMCEDGGVSMDPNCIARLSDRDPTMVNETENMICDGNLTNSYCPPQEIQVRHPAMKLEPLEVHFVPYSPSGEEEEDEYPRLSQSEEEIFKQAQPLPSQTQRKFDIKSAQHRSVPKVEPHSERRVFPEGTLITICLKDVEKDDLLVVVSPRVVTVVGLVKKRDDANNNTNYMRLGTSRLMYIYKTGVSQLVDLTGVSAGYRHGHVDLYLSRAIPPSPSTIRPEQHKSEIKQACKRLPPHGERDGERTSALHDSVHATRINMLRELHEQDVLPGREGGTSASWGRNSGYEEIVCRELENDVGTTDIRKMDIENCEVVVSVEGVIGL